MASPNLPAIVEFLKTRPLGASVREIARFLEIEDESAYASMTLLERRGSVTKGLGKRFDVPYTLSDIMNTPAVFKARETLSAMQEHIRRTL